MTYDFSPLKKRYEEIKNWLADEHRNIHTGRATPALLDGVSVEVYGAKTPIPHCATVSVEDARTLRVVPWDKGILKPLEKAIEITDMGTVSVDEAGLRVRFPDLSGERREAVAKILRGKLEEARVSVRNEREEIWNDIQKQNKDGEISDDEKFRLKEELQDLVDSATKKLEEMVERKEIEISG